MFGFRATATLGEVAFSPWVGLIGFDAGVWAGITAAGGSMGLWLLAASHEGMHTSTTQIAVRIGYLALLGAGTAVAGRRLQTSERALSSVAALQSALIDATLDGICLTDRAGNILISNAPLRRLSLELGLPPVGTVPERLLAIAPARHRPGPLSPADDRARAVVEREHERRVRAGGHGPRLPRLHGAGGRCERRLRRPDLDAARGDRRPRARPHARRLRGHRLARAAHAADLDLRLPRDDAGRGGEPRRDRAHVPGRDPAQHRAAAPAGRGPAAHRADRGAPGRARLCARRPRRARGGLRRGGPAGGDREGRRARDRHAIIRAPSAATATGSRRCSTTSSRTR